MRAGLIRRVLALYIDAFVAIVPTLLLGFLPNLFVPLDRTQNWSILWVGPLVLLALVYIFIGYAILPNSYGRYVLGTRVIDEANPARPTVGQACLRALTSGLWPIEALLIAFSKSKQRLGDRWAGTVVERYQPSEPWWKRVLPGVAIVGTSCGVLLLSIPVINGRMEISEVANSYVRTELGHEPLGSPRRVTIVDDAGEVTMRLRGGQNLRIHLSQTDKKWTVRGSEGIPKGELGRGFSIRQGSTSASAY